MGRKKLKIAKCEDNRMLKVSIGSIICLILQSKHSTSEKLASWRKPPKCLFCVITRLFSYSQTLKAELFVFSVTIRSMYSGIFKIPTGSQLMISQRKM